MRTLEWMLLASLLAWSVLHLRHTMDHATRALALFAGLAFVLHAALEGWRWQAIPLYAVLLWAVVTAVWPVGQSMSRVALGTLLASVAGLSMWALPVIEPPPLTGPRPVGVRHEHWIDTERRDSRAMVENEPRELMMSVWYPIERIESARAPFLPDIDRSLEDYARKLGWPSWALSHLRHARSRAHDGGPPARGRFPLVLYSHGLNRNRSEAATRLAELASHGQVVVAVDHPHGADFVHFPDGRVKRFVNLRERGDTLADIDRKRLSRVEIWQADLRFVLDRIAMGSERGDPLWSRVDLDRVAAMGFSNGGTTALVAAHRDDRIQAAIDLDGTPRGEVVEASLSRTVLFALSEPPWVTDEELARWGISRSTFLAPSRQVEDRMRRIAGAATAPVWIVRLAGAGHSNFTDAPLMSPLSAQLGVGGTVDSAAAMKAIDALVLDFLDAAWSGEAWTPPSHPLIQPVPDHP